MADLYDLVRKVRSELADTPKQFSKTFYGDGATTDFELSIKPLDPYTLLVRLNGDPLAQGTDIDVEARHGIIHFADAPAVGAVINIDGFHYRYFSDDELCYYVNTAVVQHTHNRSDSYGRKMSLSLIPPVEEYPLTILATVEALWALATDASFDIDIAAPDGVMVPRSERFNQLSQMVAARMQQYKDLCAMLNVGLFKIEVGVLRRTSRTTNKYVPIYIGQEIDDSRMPERVFLPTDINGRNTFPSSVPVYDLVLTQGDSYSFVLNLNEDISDMNLKAQIRTFPNSPSRYAELQFNIIKTTQPAKVEVYMTKEQTAYLPLRAFWDLQMTSKTNPNFEETIVRGQVFVQQQVTLD